MDEASGAQAVSSSVPPETSSQFDPVSQILVGFRSYRVTERGLVESSILVNLCDAESVCWPLARPLAAALTKVAGHRRSDEGASRDVESPR